LPTSNAGPQGKFCGRERAPQRSRPLGALLILARDYRASRLKSPSPRPSPREQGEGDHTLSGSRLALTLIQAPVSTRFSKS
jgi:hypothetical protein